MAFTLAHAIYWAIRAIAGAPTRITLVLLEPAIEESVRVLFVWGVLRASIFSDGWKSWLAFGLGYGGVESLAKALDLVVYVYRGGTGGLDRMAAIVTAPAVPLLLHVFLSFAALAFGKFRVPAAVALVVLFALHAAHNASALLVPPPDDFTVLATPNLVRMCGFVLLTWLLVVLSGGRTGSRRPG